MIKSINNTSIIAEADPQDDPQDDPQLVMLIPPFYLLSSYSMANWKFCAYIYHIYCTKIFFLLLLK